MAGARSRSSTEVADALSVIVTFWITVVAQPHGGFVPRT
jgi:hypothetical protein